MLKTLLILSAAAGSIAAAGIGVSKDSLRIYNNPVSSFADEIMLKNQASGAVNLDSAFLLIDEMDTTGSGAYGGLGDRFMIRWKQINPARTDMWSLGQVAAGTFRLRPASSSSSIRPGIYFPATGDSVAVAFMEIGTCLGCSGVPTWYPPYLRGKFLLYFDDGEVVTIRLYSEDMRRFLPANQPCADFSCDSMNVRKILARNGMESVPVSEVATISGGRITGLQLRYSAIPIGAITLPEPVTVIPDEIGNLTALTSITAHGNAIESISDRIGRCGSLRNVLANNNGIALLPDSIVNCTSLQILAMEHNSLERLPDSIGKLKALRSLSVTGNLLSTLPASMVKLDSLSCVFIAGNRICSLPPDIAAWLADVHMHTTCARWEPVWPDSQVCGAVAAAARTAVNASSPPMVIAHPAEHVLSVNVGGMRERVTAVALADLAGKTVSRAYSLGCSAITLPIGGLARGVYSVVLYSGARIAGVRMVLIDR